MKKQQLSERQVRWAETLSKYHFALAYRPGSQAVAPDALSRREQDLPTGDDDRLTGRHFQLLTPGRKRVIRINKLSASPQPRGDADAGDEAEPDRSNPPENPFENEELRDRWEQGLRANGRYWLIRQAVRDGARMLPHRWKLPVSLAECSIDDGGRLCWRDRIWVSHHEPLRTKLIQDTHDSTLVGHPGRETLKGVLSRRFYWPGISQDVRRFVRNCDVCGRATVWREKRRGLLKPLPIPDRHWTELSIDFITDLPPSRTSGATNIMVITDRLSKSVIYEPMTSITAEATARALYWAVCRHHGLPTAIVSDRGPQFTSLLWKRLCELMRVVRRLST